MRNLSKELVGLDFDALNDAVSQHDDGYAIFDEKSFQKTAETMGVIKIGGHVICPSGSAVWSPLWVPLTNCVNDPFQRRKFERKADWS